MGSDPIFRGVFGNFRKLHKTFFRAKSEKFVVNFFCRQLFLSPRLCYTPNVTQLIRERYEIIAVNRRSVHMLFRAYTTYFHDYYDMIVYRRSVHMLFLEGIDGEICNVLVVQCEIVYLIGLVFNYIY